MSYFTDGLAILKSDRSKLQAALADLTHPYLFVDLNEKWVAIALEQPDDAAEPWVERHSQDFPILCFWDAEDHGWAYILFHEGKQKASVEVDYDLDYKFWIQIVRILYPDMDDVHSDLDSNVSGQISHLVYGSDGYRQELEDQYSYANVTEFAIFGLSTETIDHLRDILRPELYSTPLHEPDQVDLFKEILGIREMNWKTYDVLKDELDEGYR